jgi:aminopeptidase N
MLRNQIGDSLFKNAIRNYYELYKFGNASTDNLKDVFETTTGASLTEFFDQWVYGVGHPKLQVESKISNTKVVFEIKQIGKKFNFPLTIRLNMMNGTKEDVILNVSDQKQTFTFQTSAKVKSYDLDPYVNLLFEKLK